MAGNDNIADAISIDLGPGGGTYTSPSILNRDFTKEANEPGSGYNTAWWSITPAADWVATIDTSQTHNGWNDLGGYINDTHLYVYTGTPNPAVAGWALTQVAADDDSGGNFGTSKISGLSLAGGTTYLIQVTSDAPGPDSYQYVVLNVAAGPYVTVAVDVALSATAAVDKPLAGQALAIDVTIGEPDRLDLPPADATLDTAASIYEPLNAPPADGTLAADPPAVTSQRTIAAPPATARLTAPPPTVRDTGGAGQPTPLGPLPMPTALWYLVAYRAGVPDGLISELRSAKAIKFSASLDTAQAPDQIDFTVNTNSEDMAVLGDPRGVDVVLYCNDERVIRARVLNNNGDAAGDGSHDITFTAKSYTDWLSSFVLYDTDAAVDPGYTLVEAEEIGWDLIQTAMSRPSTKLGITRGADQATGIQRTRTSYNQGDKIGDLVNKLGDSNDVDDKTPGQFEWGVDPDLVYRVYVNGRGSHESAFLLDSGGSARRFTYRYDLSKTVNVVIAEGQDLARAVVESPDLATDPGGRCEMYVKADWVPAGDANATIEGYARWVLLQNGNVPEITIDLDGAHWVTPADCWLGDFVNLDLAEGYIAVQRNDLRVVAVAGQVTDSGQAAITLTVGRKFPGVFQAIDQAITSIPAPNPLPKGANGEVLAYQDGWKALPLGFSGVRVFIQADEPLTANPGDLWFQTP